MAFEEHEMLASGSLKRSAKIPLVIKYMGIRDTCFTVHINLKHTGTRQRRRNLNRIILYVT